MDHRSVPLSYVDSALQDGAATRVRLDEKSDEVTRLRSEIIFWRRKAQQLAADLEMFLAYQKVASYQRERQAFRHRPWGGSAHDPAAGRGDRAASLRSHNLQEDPGEYIVDEALRAKSAMISKLETALEDHRHALLMKDQEIDRLNRKCNALQQRLERSGLFLSDERSSPTPSLAGFSL